MSLFIPTTTVDIYEATTTTDDFGDEVDDLDGKDGVAVPAHVWEESEQVFNPKDDRLTTVRQVRCLIPAHITVDRQARLYDRSSETYYTVEHVQANRNLVGGDSKVLTLRAVDGGPVNQ